MEHTANRPSFERSMPGGQMPATRPYARHRPPDGDTCIHEEDGRAVELRYDIGQTWMAYRHPRVYRRVVDQIEPAGIDERPGCMDVRFTQARMHLH